MSLLGHFRIRYGTADDAPVCQRLSRPFDAELGRVMRPALEAAAAKHELFVAELDGAVVGFVNWHARRDGVSVIYELAVADGQHGQGIGRALLYAVPTPMRLKCKADNDRANTFYAGAGMQLDAQTQANSGAALNVWRLDVLAELVQGNNKRMPDVARSSGMAYGTRHTEKPRDWAFAVDIHWKDYDWTVYLAKIRAWQPVQALAADYLAPEQKDTMLAQVADLQAAGVLRVMVCPKFHGAVADIPADCIVAVSIPSSYAGFVPDFSELRGRRVHLLGGSPVKWFGQTGKRRHMSATGYLAALRGAGVQVLSVDGNVHMKVASQGGFWGDGRWRLDSLDRARPFDLYALAALSGRNIVNQLNAREQVQQAGLW